jgi:catalase-peroxidase
LPPPPKTPANFEYVKQQIKSILFTKTGPYDVTADNTSYVGALLVDLAYQSASTFRLTDYSGGANGARIRFPQEGVLVAANSKLFHKRLNF